MQSAVVDQAIADGDASYLETVLSLKKRVTFDELDAWIAKSEHAAVVHTFLAEYKNRLLNSADVQKGKERKRKEPMCEKTNETSERTVADWKKLFKFKTENNQVTILKCLSTDTVIEVPPAIGKAPVTKIASSAFEHCDAQQVILPDGLVQIDAYAFFECRNLYRCLFRIA